jgi:hypothetical protein
MAELKKLINARVPGLKSQGHLRQMVGQYVDPLHHAPIRLPDVGSATCLGTAVATLSLTTTLDWSATEIDGTKCPVVDDGNGDTLKIVDGPYNRLVVSVRDPACLGIVQEGPFPTTASVYQGGLYDPEISIVSGIPMDWQLGFMSLSSGPKRYEDSFTSGVVSDGSVQVVWIDASAGATASLTYMLSFVAGAYTNTAHATAELLRWTDDETFDVEKTALVNLTGLDSNMLFSFIEIVHSGYYSVRFVVNDSDDAHPCLGVHVTYNSAQLTVQTQFTFVHVVHTAVYNELLSPATQPLIGQVRVLGNTFLATNTTAEMFKSGTVYARQIDGTLPWYLCCKSPDDFTSANVMTSYDGPMSKGLYSVVKPQGEGCMDLHDLRLGPSYTGTNPVIVNMAPFKFQGVLPMLFCPAAPTAAAPSASLTIHFVRGIEFTTQSQLMNVNVSEVARVEILALLDELAHVPQFYENPLHLKAIAAALARAGKWAWANKSEIAAVAKAIAAVLSKVGLAA